MDTKILSNYYLLEYSDRIELNARAINGRTALMLACDSGHKDIVKLLLKYPDIDISGYDQSIRSFIFNCIN